MFTVHSVFVMSLVSTFCMKLVSMMVLAVVRCLVRVINTDLSFVSCRGLNRGYMTIQTFITIIFMYVYKLTNFSK